jgi:hypothetical protein
MLRSSRRSRLTRNEQLEQENCELRAAVVESLKASQELNRRLVDSQDKVITSRFDAPLRPRPQAQPDNGGLFPQDALGDAEPQGEDLVVDASVLSVDDDREFLEKVYG